MVLAVPKVKSSCNNFFRLGGVQFFWLARLACSAPAQHSVHPTGGSLRVFRQFAWLEVGSGKAALSRPAHPRVTQPVRRDLQLREWQR
jgi:hypothetical protein